MGQGESVGAVYIKRLCESWARGARGRVTHMAYSHLARESAHMSRSKHIFDQAIIFTKIQLTLITGHNPGCVLASMLKYG